jgi:hypothetical protein
VARPAVDDIHAEAALPVVAPFRAITSFDNEHQIACSAGQRVEPCVVIVRVQLRECQESNNGTEGTLRVEQLAAAPHGKRGILEPPAEIVADDLRSVY